jgi:hypothetical protein
VLEGLNLSGVTLELHGWPPPQGDEIAPASRPSQPTELIPPEVHLSYATLMPPPPPNAGSTKPRFMAANKAGGEPDTGAPLAYEYEEAHHPVVSPPGPCLKASGTPLRLVIAHSIVGAMQFDRGGLIGAPVSIEVHDSILDAGGSDSWLITDPRGCVAPAVATIRRATVRGIVHLHALDLGEDSIFLGRLEVARRQRGAVRYCYIAPVPGTRTPQQTACQPPAASSPSDTSPLRIQPLFVHRTFGQPGYFQLAIETHPKVLAGASDESEMGAFHDLFESQRAARLLARVVDAVPADYSGILIFVN